MCHFPTTSRLCSNIRPAVIRKQRHGPSHHVTFPEDQTTKDAGSCWKEKSSGTFTGCLKAAFPRAPQPRDKGLGAGNRALGCMITLWFTGRSRLFPLLHELCSWSRSILWLKRCDFSLALTGYCQVQGELRVRKKQLQEKQKERKSYYDGPTIWGLLCPFSLFFKTYFTWPFYNCLLELSLKTWFQQFGCATTAGRKSS